MKKLILFFLSALFLVGCVKEHGKVINRDTYAFIIPNVVLKGTMQKKLQHLYYIQTSDGRRYTIAQTVWMSPYGDYAGYLREAPYIPYEFSMGDDVQFDIFILDKGRK